MRYASLKKLSTNNFAALRQTFKVFKTLKVFLPMMGS